MILSQDQMVENSSVNVKNKSSTKLIPQKCQHQNVYWQNAKLQAIYSTWDKHTYIFGILGQGQMVE